MVMRMTNENKLWVEKYRPRKFEDVVGQDKIVERIKAFVDNNNIMNMIFFGPAGVGKTTLAMIIARTVYGDNWSGNFKEINASDDSGIDVVRGQIKTFARSIPLGDVDFKIVFLDEADRITVAGQQALRRTMEKYSDTCRFILSCNYEQEIIEPIRSSRLVEFGFKPLKNSDIEKRLSDITKIENKNVSSEVISKLVIGSNGDMRRAINELQKLCIGRDTVTIENMIDAKNCDYITLIRNITEKKQITIKTDIDDMLDKGVSEQDIIEGIWFTVFCTDDVEDLNISKETRCAWIDILADFNLRYNQRVIKGLQMDAMLNRLCESII